MTATQGGGNGNDKTTAMRGNAELIGGFGDDTLTLGDFGGTAIVCADLLVLDEADTAIDCLTVEHILIAAPTAA